MGTASWFSIQPNATATCDSLAHVIALWCTAWTHDGDLLGVNPLADADVAAVSIQTAVFIAAAGVTHALVPVV